MSLRHQDFDEDFHAAKNVQSKFFSAVFVLRGAHSRAAASGPESCHCRSHRLDCVVAAAGRGTEVDEVDILNILGSAWYSSEHCTRMVMAVTPKDQQQRAGPRKRQSFMSGLRQVLHAAS